MERKSNGMDIYRRTADNNFRLPQNQILMNIFEIAPGRSIYHNLTDGDFAAVAQKWEKAGRPQTPKSLACWINHQADKGYWAVETTDDYRLLKAYSNSRLGQIKDQLMRRPTVGPKRAFVFGQALHEILLEPQKVELIEEFCLTPSEEKTLHRMTVAAQRWEALQWARYAGKPEQVFTWKDAATRLPCKMKCDLVVESETFSRLIIDIKTTSAATQEEFEAAALRYEYDRQGAFYMDGAKASSFALMAISKVKPYNTFTYTFRRRQKATNKARKHYRFILAKAKQLGIEP